MNVGNNNDIVVFENSKNLSIKEILLFIYSYIGSLRDKILYPPWE